MKGYIQSLNPSESSIINTHKVTSKINIDMCVKKSSIIYKKWSVTSYEYRRKALKSFQSILTKNKKDLVLMISKENGKCIFEADLEVTAAINKVDLTIQAFENKQLAQNLPKHLNSHKLSFKPIGLMVVLGPFNFPIHLPLGHILPAILAGNCVILKPSEYVIGITKLLMLYFEQSSIMSDVVQCVYGSSYQARYLISHSRISGILFTGSYKTAQSISSYISRRPELLFAMECGGNNPLVISSFKEQLHTIHSILKSAYLTSGQRCTCARRLIVVDTVQNRQLIDSLIKAIEQIKIADYKKNNIVNLGPLISESSCVNALSFYDFLIKTGGIALVEMKRSKRKGYFVSPALVDVSSCYMNVPDQECFGPLLQLIYVKTFKEACEVANNTHYGLSASVFTRYKREFSYFFNHIQAGIINWNQPTNGASSLLPFGGVGKSGNYRPAGYTAIDSCVYPISSTLNG